MSESLIEIIESFFVGPVWPASILLVLMMLYAVIAMFGLIDLDMDMDVDLDLDVDAPDLDVGGLDGGVDAGVDGGIDGGVDADGVSHVSGAGLLGSLGAITVRWTNFGRVPIAIWGGIFTLAFWCIGYGMWHCFDFKRYDPTWIASTLLAIRNAVVAVMITKGVTQPLVGKFATLPGYDTGRIVGATCEISSIEATPTFGQAKFRTDAAPLLLNVRTDGPTIARGTEVKIVEFDPTKRTYTVTNIQPETLS
ncbi:MAG: DUF1449 domain-containing protein [Pirellulaceae bacterium]|nr:DUF1449 domain-containing protein [Pirellulaceae bacterium]